MRQVAVAYETAVNVHSALVPTNRMKPLVGNDKSAAGKPVPVNVTSVPPYLLPDVCDTAEMTSAYVRGLTEFAMRA